MISFPIIGILFYLSVGLSYRKKKLYQKKLETDEHSLEEVEQYIQNLSRDAIERSREKIGYFFPLTSLFRYRKLTSDNNHAEVLINGEEKFKRVIEDLRGAKHHIHIEYYIYNDSIIGNEIADILIEKAREGVEVRFIYDALGSKGVERHLIKRLREAGVEAHAFYEFRSIYVANRINYRNHRKIIVVDGIIGYVGGINVSDEYINSPTNDLYWRDTHLRIAGKAVISLQTIFILDWNFCSHQNIGLSTKYFPRSSHVHFGNAPINIISSGPDSDYPDIMYSFISGILLARKEVCITTPYFIPDKSFLDALKIASLSGVKVRLLVPGIPDNIMVNLTSRSFYESLLEAGIQVYQYQKGFVHAKTLVYDRQIAVIGTANMDNRSFDLNFEVSAIVYDTQVSGELMDQFEIDVSHSKELTLEEWQARPLWKRFAEKVMNLFSPLL